MTEERLPAKENPLRRLNQLLLRANAGDREALRALRSTLKESPELWTYLGDVAAVAERAFLLKMTGGNIAVEEAIQRTLAALRTELLEESTSPVERLLVDRIAACWLHLAYVEEAYYQSPSNSWQQDEHYQRRIDRAQKRYLAAIKALATVRRLAVPAVQLNVAEQQINLSRGS